MKKQTVIIHKLKKQVTIWQKKTEVSRDKLRTALMKMKAIKKKSCVGGLQRKKHA